VDVAVADTSQKRTAESPLEIFFSKNRRVIDYVEKDSNKFKGPENQCPYPSVPLMEPMELDFRSPETATFGRPRKDIDHRKVQRIARKCEELKVKLVLAEEETEAHNAKLTMEVEDLQYAVDASLSSESAYLAPLAVMRQELGIARSHAQLAEAEAAQAERQQVAAEESLSTLQLPVDADHLIGCQTDEAEMYGKAKKYCPNNFFQYINILIRVHGKWIQHAKDLLHMSPLRHLLIGLVIVFLRETMFTRNKWAQAVDMDHRLNLGGIEVILEMEGNKKGCMGLVWSSGTIKDVHRAVEREMMSKVSFKLIGEAHQEVWVDGVELDVKELLISIITHYGLEAKARATGCEISITVDGAKLDDYCCYITCGFKLIDKDSRDPLSGRLLFDTMQSERKCIPIVSIIAKDNKATYDRFLTHLFEFGNWATKSFA
jgi:hypothetical protein